MNFSYLMLLCLLALGCEINKKIDVKFPGVEDIATPIASTNAYKGIIKENYVKLSNSTAVDVLDYYLEAEVAKWLKKNQYRLSWYNEGLGTSTRGNIRDFPSHVKILATSSSVTIYDATQLSMPMWKVYDQTFSGITSIAMAGGVLFISRNNGSPSLRLNFTNDTVYTHYVNSTATGMSSSNVANITGAAINNGVGGILYVPNISVDKVAMVVMQNAPLDNNGLSIPTIACSTAPGTSVFNGPAGVETVVNILNNLDNTNDVDLTSNRLSIAHGNGRVSIGEIPRTSSGISRWRDRYYSPYGETIPALLGGAVTGVANGKGIASSRGVCLLDENISDVKKGAVTYITNTYNTGQMIGDIKTSLINGITAGDVGQEIIDRSNGGNNSAKVTGILTSQHVAYSSELMSVSGFVDGTAYATIPSSSDFAFGAGEALISVWFLARPGSYEYLFSIDGEGGTIYAVALADGTFNVAYGTTRVKLNRIGLNDEKWHQFLLRKSGSKIDIFIDNVLDTSFRSEALIKDSVVHIGTNRDLQGTLAGALALLNISKTAALDKQIHAKYEQESPMFFENSKVALRSKNIKSIDYDTTTDLLLVGTEGGPNLLSGGNVHYLSDPNMTASDSLAVSLEGDAYTIATANEVISYTPSLDFSNERVVTNSALTAAIYEAQNGVEYKFIRLTSPRLIRIHTLRVDLTNNRIRPVAIIPPDPDGDGPAHTVLTAPMTIATGHDLIAFINANPWGDIHNEGHAWYEGQHVTIQGLSASAGEIRSRGASRKDSTVWTDDGGGVLFDGLPENNPVEAVTGFSRIVDNGIDILEDVRDVEDLARHPNGYPRTSICLNKDKTTMWMVAMDGKRPEFSEGMTLKELAAFMIDLGCWTAINMDGGGSTTMGMTGNDGILRIVNSGSDKPVIRPLPAIWGIQKR